MLLAGDIGGTKTSLAVFSADGGPKVPVAGSTFPSTQYQSLEAVVVEFLSQVSLQVDRACFGVAGPVLGGRAQLTNLPWEMEEARLAERLGLASVRLVNDLQCVATAIPLLGTNDLHTLSEGHSEPTGALGVIAPGTGLGEAFMVWTGSRYQACASEGGQTDFAPSSPLELGLLQYLREIYGHVSCERVCSGLGIPNIYAYLKASGYAQEPEWFAQELARASDPTPLIVSSALHGDRRCALCVAALDTFVSILGAESANLALKVLATGGVYLGGGIPPRILPALSDGRFIESFRNKGRFAGLMARIPIHVILNRQAALLGAAAYGLEL